MGLNLGDATVTILAAISAGIVLIGLVLLLSPFRLRGQYSDGGGLFAVRYLGVEVSFQLPAGIWTVRLLGLRLWTGRSVPSRDGKPRVRRKPKPKTRLDLGRRVALLRSHSPVVRRASLTLGRLLGRLAAAWHLEDGYVELTLGTGNPAHTGMMAGYAQAIRHGLRRLWPLIRVDFTPVFNERVVRFQAGLMLRIIPLRPVYDIMRAVGSLPWRGLWKLKRAWVS
jgi:hypothetical protein